MKKLRTGMREREDWAFDEEDCLLSNANPLNSNLQSANNVQNPNIDQVVEEDKVEPEAVADNQMIDTGLD